MCGVSEEGNQKALQVVFEARLQGMRHDPRKEVYPKGASLLCLRGVDDGSGMANR